MAENDWFKKESTKLLDFIENASKEEFDELLKKANVEYYNQFKMKIFSDEEDTDESETEKVG